VPLCGPAMWPRAWWRQAWPKRLEVAAQLLPSGWPGPTSISWCRSFGTWKAGRRAHLTALRPGGTSICARRHSSKAFCGLRNPSQERGGRFYQMSSGLWPFIGRHDLNLPSRAHVRETNARSCGRPPVGKRLRRASAQICSGDGAAGTPDTLALGDMISAEQWAELRLAWDAEGLRIRG